MSGRVDALFVAAAGGGPLQGRNEGMGVGGGGDLEAITAGTDVDVTGGQHRRNIVTRGVDLRGLAGWRFRIGEAVFRYDRPRPPCRYIEGLTQPGMTRALAARRGGICARVVESGLIRVGDTIELLDQDSIVERIAGPLLRRPN